MYIFDFKMDEALFFLTISVCSLACTGISISISGEASFAKKQLTVCIPSNKGELFHELFNTQGVQEVRFRKSGEASFAETPRSLHSLCIPNNKSELFSVQFKSL